MTEPTTADYHLSIDGALQGPLDQATAYALAAEAVGAGWQVFVWRPGWGAWAHPSHVWPAAQPGAQAGLPTWPKPRTPPRRQFLLLGLLMLGVVGVVVALAAWAAPRPEPAHDLSQHLCTSCGDESRPCAAAVALEVFLPEECESSSYRWGGCGELFGERYLETHDDYDLISLLYYSCTNASLTPRQLSDGHRLLEHYVNGSYDLFIDLRTRIEKEQATR